MYLIFLSYKGIDAGCTHRLYNQETAMAQDEGSLLASIGGGGR